MSAIRQANNQGLRALGFEQGCGDDAPRYALALNPDTVLPPDRAARDGRLYGCGREIGVAGPKLVMLDGNLDLACRRSFPTPEISFYRMVGLSKLFPHSRRFGRYNMTYLDPDVETEVDSVVGAFMLVRREAIQPRRPVRRSVFYVRRGPGLGVSNQTSRVESDVPPAGDGARTSNGRRAASRAGRSASSTGRC